jgi:circadian clock protein KaiB
LENTSKYFRESDNFKFILFVSGMSAKSLRAIENINKIGDEYFGDVFDLEVIDISRHTEQARNYQVIAIPTLIKVSPAPPRIIVGDLSDTKKVLKILDIVDG